MRTKKRKPQQTTITKKENPKKDVDLEVEDKEEGVKGEKGEGRGGEGSEDRE